MTSEAGVDDQSRPSQIAVNPDRIRSLDPPRRDPAGAVTDGVSPSCPECPECPE